MASFIIDVSLSEVSNRELIEELEGRYLNSHEQRWLIDLLKSDDKQKLDLFFQVKDKHSLLELEGMLNEKVGEVLVSENQLSLEL